MKRFLLLGLLPLLAARKDADLVLIQDEFAKCLDGSPPAYYFRKGEGSGANKWILYHEAGAWCGSLNSCYFRSKMDLGSSTQYPVKGPPYTDFISDNATLNPILYNWNMVYLKNCDGGVFTGENLTVATYRDRQLYFRGAYNRRALLRDLKENRGMVKPSEVLISGCSAGAMQTYLHADWYASMLPKDTFVFAMADSGFMIPFKAAGKCNYEELMIGALQLFNSSASIHPACAELFKESGEVWRCIFFPQYTLPHVKTPLFALNSRVDSWATEHIFCGGGPNLLANMTKAVESVRTDRINQYGHMFDEAFYPAVRANPQNGYVVDSCHHHCGGWGSITLPDGRTQAAAFADWYNALKQHHQQHGAAAATQLLDVARPLIGGNQTANFPCQDCCGAHFKPDKRYRSLRRNL